MLLSAPIALGFTAEIYAWEAGQVLKLFNQGISRGTVEYEARLTQFAHNAGLPVPAVGEVIEIEGRFGLELERVEGLTMLEALIKQPWRTVRYARQLAELQVGMHKLSVPEMPSQRERLRSNIHQARQLTEHVRQAALNALEQLPEDDKLCHGDFHPNNILLTSHGPVIIDWIDASGGFPLADVARSTLLFGGGPLPAGIPPSVRIIRRWLYQVYIGRYFQLNQVDRQSLFTWVGVCAAARLAENTLYDEARLLALAQTLTRSK